MSLLEKAIRGPAISPAQPRTSLFTRALAAREPEARAAPEDFGADAFNAGGFEGLRGELTALRPEFDSFLQAWTLVFERVRLAAIALFLPKDGFLALAAQNGFPAGTEEAIPLSIANPPHRSGEALANEAKALLAPILGVPLSLSLRASSMRTESGLAGMWVYHDPALDSSQAEVRAELGAILAGALSTYPAISLESPSANAPAALLAAGRKFSSAAVLSFELPTIREIELSRFKGLTPNALRSVFIAAYRRILAQGGSVLAFGERSVGCALGSATAVDPDLALFQLKKTIKRILPFLSAEFSPEGRALRLDPSSETAFEELSRFLSE